MDELLREALEMLRYYRGRIHASGESEDGGRTKYHNVYGVHHDAMKRADRILQQAKELGILAPTAEKWEFHS